MKDIAKSVGITYNIEPENQSIKSMRSKHGNNLKYNIVNSRILKKIPNNFF